MSEEETPLSLQQLMAVVAEEGPDQFVGQTESYGVIGVYGGHFVGQALAAGFATVDEPKLAHSLHCYFLQPGDPSIPLHYSVVRLREGRASDVRSITATQRGRAVFQMMASFKLAEPGDEHQPTAPDVTDVSALLTAGGTHFSPPPTAKGRTEMVFASEHFMRPEFTPGREPALRLWTRCVSGRELTERESQVGLAFLSDSTLMFNAVLPHGLPFQTHRLTSIDHAVWFHRQCDARQWMLFDQWSSAAADGRGLNHGSLFDAKGQLIFTTAQESMLRRTGS